MIDSMKNQIGRQSKHRIQFATELITAAVIFMIVEVLLGYWGMVVV